MMRSALNYTGHVIMGRTGGKYVLEIAVRLLLATIFVATEFAQPAMVLIQPDELWVYRYPNLSSQIPIEVLFIFIILGTAFVMAVFGIHKKYRNNREIFQLTMAITLSVPLAGALTNIIKCLVGRPRPNFLARCYGKDYLNVIDATKPCVAASATGDLRKSFPSGHSSLAFSAFVLLSLYICGKTGALNISKPFRSWRLIVSFLPTLCSIWIAASRYTDYHHHPTDILAGAMLGIIVAYICYTRYYPEVTNPYSKWPLSWISMGVLYHKATLDINAIEIPANPLIACPGNDSLLKKPRINESTMLRYTVYVGECTSNIETGLRFYWQNNSPLVGADQAIVRNRLASELSHPPELQDAVRVECTGYESDDEHD